MWHDYWHCYSDSNRISTHTSRVGCDAIYSSKPRASNLFLLTHPVWDVTEPVLLNIFTISFLLTHPVWDVTPGRSKTSSVFKISTHTSRVGCDPGYTARITAFHNFYSHIPCGMWRNPIRTNWGDLPFLLTHPVWDVTTATYEGSLYDTFLLTHPVWDVTMFLSVLECVL